MLSRIAPSRVAPNRVTRWGIVRFGVARFGVARFGIARFGIVRDRRGITAMTFAFMAFALLAFVGLSSEVGSWFFLKTQAQAAADGAAVAAVLALNAGTDPGAAAGDVMTLNGFATSAVSIVGTPQVPDYTASPPVLAQATVTVSLSVAPVIASLFVNASAITVNAQASATMLPLGTACVLATSGDLTISVAQVNPASPTQPGSVCSYVSDAVDSTAINIQGGADVTQVYALVSAGGCANCPASADLDNTTRPVSTYQPPVIDPYQATLSAITLPTSSQATSQTGVTCLPDPSTTGNRMVPATGNGSTYPWSPSTNYYAYCSDVTISSGQTVTLFPGVYFFIDARLIVQGGATMQCTTTGYPNSGQVCSTDLGNGTTGVSLVFTGSNPADVMPTVQISATANVNLGPPAASDVLAAAFAPLATNGVLIWRDGSMANTATGIAADIEGGSATTGVGLNGLMYFPNATVTFGASNPQGLSGCMTLVAATISLANQPSSFWDCNAGVGYPTPQVQTVRINQ